MIPYKRIFADLLWRFISATSVLSVVIFLLNIYQFASSALRM